MAFNVDDYLPARNGSGEAIGERAPQLGDDAERKGASVGARTGVTQAGSTQVSYNGIKPWYSDDAKAKGLKIVAGTTRNADNVLRDAGLEWTVEPRTMDLRGMTMDQVDALDDYRAFVRSDTGKVLHVASPRWTPLSNHDLFHSTDPLTDAGFATWETAGALFGGKKVWGQLRLDWQGEVVPGDIVHMYALVFNAHDGTRQGEWLWTSVRAVCNNTIRAGRASGAMAIRARHTKGALTNAMGDARRLYGGIVETAERTLRTYKALAELRIEGDRSREFLGALLPDPESSAPDSAAAKRAKERADAVRDEIYRLSRAGNGQSIDSVLGTGWALLNGVTEYVDHQAFDKRSPESRQDAVMFGDGDALKTSALDGLVAMLPATVRATL